MEKHKIIGEMYGVVLLIEQEYDELDIKEEFYEYAKRRTLELFGNAIEWRAEDEREKSQKIGQDI